MWIHVSVNELCVNYVHMWITDLAVPGKRNTAVYENLLAEMKNKSKIYCGRLQ